MQRAVEEPGGTTPAVPEIPAPTSLVEVEQPAITAAVPATVEATPEAARPEPAPMPVAELVVPVAQITAPPVVEEKLTEHVPPAPVPVEAPKLQLDWSSDLTQVETDPVKLEEARDKAPADTPAARVKRERPPVPPVSDEPLVQIETRKPGTFEPGALSGPAPERASSSASV
jgi:ribonuclease E